DFFFGGGSVRSDLDVDRLGQFAIAQHLDAVQRLGDDAGLQQSLGINSRAGLELLEVRHFDGNILRSENVVETALRQTALQGHLAAFKAGLLDAGAGLLALVAVTGGLAVAGTGAAALAGHGLPGAGGRLQFMKFHACTSLRYALVTTTRWEILAILPWVAALSGCSVTSPGRRSPRECATAICSLPRPIRLLARRMVTFSIVVPSL